MEISKKELETAIEGSHSTKEVLKSLGYNASTDNYRQIKKISARYKIVLPKYKRKFQNTTLTFDEIFRENSPYSARQNMRKMLVSMGILLDQCDECKIGTEWNNKKLTLQVDHINGVGDDNRIENLRLLCPNCHSQTDTFCGKKKPVDSLKYKNLCSCGEYKHFKSSHCRSCAQHVYKTSVPPERAIWPTDEELIRKIKESNFRQVGKSLGVSDVAIRKRLSRRGYDPKNL